MGDLSSSFVIVMVDDGDDDVVVAVVGFRGKGEDGEEQEKQEATASLTLLSYPVYVASMGGSSEGLLESSDME